MRLAMRFHLDEHVAHAVAEGLRRRGIDVTTSNDAGLLEAPDEEHVAFALREGRVIVTHDADFLRLHAQRFAHHGVVFVARGGRSIGDVVRHLTLMHDCLAETDMHGRVEFI
jgi:predicted nuclease of predicted toxin-antitoxin system